MPKSPRRRRVRARPTSIHSSTRPAGVSAHDLRHGDGAGRPQRPQPGRLPLEQCRASGSGWVLANSGPLGVVQPVRLGDVAAADRRRRGDAQAVDQLSRQRGHGAHGRSASTGGRRRRGGRTSRCRRSAAGPTDRARLDVRRPGDGPQQHAPWRRAASSGASSQEVAPVGASIATTRSKRSKSSAVNCRARCSMRDASAGRLGQRVLVRRPRRGGSGSCPPSRP